MFCLYCHEGNNKEGFNSLIGVAVNSLIGTRSCSSKLVCIGRRLIQFYYQSSGSLLCNPAASLISKYPEIVKLQHGSYEGTHNNRRGKILKVRLYPRHRTYIFLQAYSKLLAIQFQLFRLSCACCQSSRRLAPSKWMFWEKILDFLDITSTDNEETETVPKL